MRLVRKPRSFTESSRLPEACCHLWSAYGALTGVAVMLLVHHVVEPSHRLLPRGMFPYLLLHETLQGALAGALFGAVIGGMVGMVGHRLGGRVGWCVAGSLGGLGIVGGFLVYLIPRIDPYYELLDLPLPYARIATWGLGYLLTGGLLGLAVGRAVESGESDIPGVEYVAHVVREAKPPVDTLESADLTPEVVPASPPQGRGNEASSIEPPTAPKERDRWSNPFH